MHCIDSDLALAILKGDPEARSTLDVLEHEGAVAITSISVFELTYVTKGLSKQRKTTIMNFLDTLTILDMDKHAALSASSIGRKLNKKGQILHPMDLLIGAIVLQNQLPFVTRNVKHFERIKGLKLRTW